LFRNSFPAAACLLLSLSGPGFAQTAAEPLSMDSLRALDTKVATIGHRLAVAGTDLCSDRQWLSGFVVHDASQYARPLREEMIRALGLDRGPGVLALAVDGPAARAGLRPDDVLLAADGAPLPAEDRPSDRGTFDHGERILEALDRAFADGRAELAILRGPEPMRFEVVAEQGCASRFQLVLSRRLNAWANGRYVQVTTRIAEYVRDDDELAAVLAHEFAHNVMRHRLRLDEAGVARGFFGNFGRNARLIRETEAEADRLSIYLLDRAGYDPEAAVRFWSRFGPRGLSLLESPNHPHWRQRIAMFREEIDVVRQARAAGSTPVPRFLSPPAREGAAPSG
jgi:hypothetical protein